MAVRLYISHSRDGQINLATDEYLLEHARPEDMLLHFYINASAVIIGRGQNPYVECDLDAMRRDGVQLVRRITGGGAVFHDEGNLNFSFIAGEDLYSVPRQLELLMRVLRPLGVPCEAGGRNDMMAGGRKFSGNAFCRRRQLWQHHGTLLVSSDLYRLPRYLHADPRKLASKGIKSVFSRVCNLTEFDPAITTGLLIDRISAAFAEEYGPYERLTPERFDADALRPYIEKHRSPEWLLGSYARADVDLSERFPWGGVQLQLILRDGLVAEANVFSDANDVTIVDDVRAALKGRPYTAEALAAALRSSPKPELSDIADFLARSL